MLGPPPFPFVGAEVLQAVQLETGSAPFDASAGDRAWRAGARAVAIEPSSGLRMLSPEMPHSAGMHRVFDPHRKREAGGSMSLMRREAHLEGQSERHLAPETTDGGEAPASRVVPSFTLHDKKNFNSNDCTDLLDWKFVDNLAACAETCLMCSDCTGFVIGVSGPSERYCKTTKKCGLEYVVKAVNYAYYSRNEASATQTSSASRKATQCSSAVNPSPSTTLTTTNAARITTTAAATTVATRKGRKAAITTTVAATKKVKNKAISTNTITSTAGASTGTPTATTTSTVARVTDTPTTKISRSRNAEVQKGEASDVNRDVPGDDENDLQLASILKDTMYTVSVKNGKEGNTASGKASGTKLVLSPCSGDCTSISSSVEVSIKLPFMFDSVRGQFSQRRAPGKVRAPDDCAVSTQAFSSWTDVARGEGVVMFGTPDLVVYGGCMYGKKFKSENTEIPSTKVPATDTLRFLVAQRLRGQDVEIDVSKLIVHKSMSATSAPGPSAADVPRYKNVGNNFCASSEGRPVEGTATPSADGSLQECQARCSASASCSAIQYFPPRWRKTKCHLFLSETLVTQSSSFGRKFQTTGTCYIKDPPPVSAIRPTRLPDTTTVAEVVATTEAPSSENATQKEEETQEEEGKGKEEEKGVTDSNKSNKTVHSALSKGVLQEGAVVLGKCDGTTRFLHDESLYFVCAGLGNSLQWNNGRLDGDFSLDSTIRLAGVNQSHTALVFWSNDLVDSIVIDGRGSAVYYEGSHWGESTKTYDKTPVVPGKWCRVFVQRLNGVLSVELNGKSVASGIPMAWRPSAVGWRPSQNKIAIAILRLDLRGRRANATQYPANRTNTSAAKAKNTTHVSNATHAAKIEKDIVKQVATKIAAFKKANESKHAGEKTNATQHAVKKAKHEKQGFWDDKDEAESGASGEGGSSMMFIVLGVAVLLLVIAAAGWAYQRKQDEAAALQAQQAAKAAGEAAPQPTAEDAVALAEEQEKQGLMAGLEEDSVEEDEWDAPADPPEPPPE